MPRLWTLFPVLMAIEPSSPKKIPTGVLHHSAGVAVAAGVGTGVTVGWFEIVGGKDSVGFAVGIGEDVGRRDGGWGGETEREELGLGLGSG